MAVRYLTSGFYVNPHSIIAIGVIFTILGILAVAGRFAARYRSRLDFRADDWLCIPALICTVGLGITYIYGGAAHILGNRLPADEDLRVVLGDPTYDPKPQLRIEYASNLLCGIGSGLIRLSFLFYFRRIFRGRTFDIISWTLIGAVILWIVLSTLLLFTICGSYLSVVWTSNVVYVEKCPHMLPFLGAAAAVQFALDVMIWTLPFPWIWRLQMRTANKLAVSSVFLCGLFTVAASAVRLVVGVDAINFSFGSYENILGLKTDNDTIGATAVWLFWSYIEVGTGMVVCCLPSLKPILNKASFDTVSSLKSALIKLSPTTTRKTGDSTDSSSSQDTTMVRKNSAEGIKVTKSWQHHTEPKGETPSVTNSIHGTA